MDRRAFLARGAAVAGSTVVASEALTRLSNRMALADMRANGRSGYGPPAPMPDQRGRVVLALPAGFSYVTFGDIGSPLSDGTPTPLALDGMAAFRGPHGTVRLIRNHEDRNTAGAGSLKPRAGAYDPLAGGGTTTLDYDPRRRRLVRSFISLDGTTINCAGGFGLRERSWLTGEETIAGQTRGFAQPHGYLFEVPLDRDAHESPHSEPLRAMGRFAHEAAATDERTGIVYETEDPGSGRGAGFYRFLPRDPHRLSRGGTLQILGIRGAPQYDAREGQEPGRRLPVTWIDVPEPDPEYANDDDPRGTFQQGRRLGAAMFNRLEGCWYTPGSVFFVSTSGGDKKSLDPPNADGYREGYGQVWEYRTRSRQLVLHYESPGGEVLDSPDNLTVTPRGGLMLCEDDASEADAADPNRVIGLTPRGEAFTFAENVFSESELAGVCFSPDGETMFVNLYGASTGTPVEHADKGMTCAITGPWRKGPL
ncbi:MAG TPA: alkaline phosphatase PhoX [Solirubrobacteraceae bacterium]|nr:alkaline phosphatase PhoX [Solirubrobacteraceae bacterium]